MSPRNQPKQQRQNSETRSSASKENVPQLVISDPSPTNDKVNLVPSKQQKIVLQEKPPKSIMMPPSASSSFIKQSSGTSSNGATKYDL